MVTKLWMRFTALKNNYDCYKKKEGVILKKQQTLLSSCLTHRREN